MNYTRFFTKLSLNREPSAIRKINALFQAGPPSMISLAGGNPNPSLFPFKKMNFQLHNNQSITLEENRLMTALQYSPTPGIPPLLEWMRKLQDREHKPKREYEMCMTTGSQEALCRSIEMLTNPGDYVIVDKPSYAGALAALRPLQVKFIEVQTDEFGTVPESLEIALEPWKDTDPLSEASDMPRYMYSIPNGVNPTGACLTLERKQQLYKIAQRYNLLILEDDPYYYLQFVKPAPSFFSMDVDGRVIRFDSFSKIISSGMRIGMASGPKELITRIVLHNMISSLHCSSLSQVLLLELFDQWDIDGFFDHTKKVAQFYADQKDATLAALNKHLTGLATWKSPDAGMFFWVKLLGIADTNSLAEKAVKKDVLFLPGSVFMANDKEQCSYIRLSFSISTPEQIDKAIKNIAELVKEEKHNSIK